MTFSNGYNKLTMGYFEQKLHKYMLGTPDTNITSCKKGHNRCLLNSLKGCAGGDFTECWTFTLSIQELDQKCMHLLMKIT